MYIAYDDDENIVAFHDKKRVVKQYIKDVKRCNELNLTLKKLSKNDMNHLDGLDDLYLVRFGHTYVQCGYLLYVQISSDQEYADHEFAKDILYRLLETKTLTDKEQKSIRKAVAVLENVIYDEAHYVPSLKTLKRIKIDYEPYLYSTGLL